MKAKPTAAKKIGQSIGFSAEEKAAAKAYVRELKAQAANADMEKECLARIAEMPPSDRAMAKKIHTLIKAKAPELTAKTWYGMPAYAKDGETLCFFQSAAKFKARYATLGFTGKATLDNGNMWPTSYALTKLTPADETKIAALLKKATS